MTEKMNDLEMMDMLSQNAAKHKRLITRHVDFNGGEYFVEKTPKIDGTGFYIHIGHLEGEGGMKSKLIVPSLVETDLNGNIINVLSK